MVSPTMLNMDTILLLHHLHNMITIQHLSLNTINLPHLLMITTLHLLNTILMPTMVKCTDPSLGILNQFLIFPTKRILTDTQCPHPLPLHQSQCCLHITDHMRSKAISNIILLPLLTTTVITRNLIIPTIHTH